MNSAYSWFGGKSTFFAFWFFVFGVILAFLGHLTGQYIALAGALQTIIATRSICDDLHERGMAKIKNGNGDKDAQNQYFQKLQDGVSK